MQVLADPPWGRLPNGREMRGSWENDLMCGETSVIWPSGSTYDGWLDVRAPTAGPARLAHGGGVEVVVVVVR